MVELGKALATDARAWIAEGRKPGAQTSPSALRAGGVGNVATATLLSHYLQPNAKL